LRHTGEQQKSQNGVIIEEEEESEYDKLGNKRYVERLTVTDWLGVHSHFVFYAGMKTTKLLLYVLKKEAQRKATKDTRSTISSSAYIRRMIKDFFELKSVQQRNKF